MCHFTHMHMFSKTLCWLFFWVLFNLFIRFNNEPVGLEKVTFFSLVCIVTSSDGGMGRFGGGSFMLGFGWGDRGWVSCFFYFLFCFCAVVDCSLMVGT